MALKQVLVEKYLNISLSTEADKDAQLTADSQFKMKANIENQG